MVEARSLLSLQSGLWSSSWMDCSSVCFRRYTVNAKEWRKNKTKEEIHLSAENSTISKQNKTFTPSSSLVISPKIYHLHNSILKNKYNSFVPVKHLFLSIWCWICKPKIFTQSCRTKPLMHAECWLWTCLHSKYKAVDLPVGISKNIINSCLILAAKAALTHRVMLPLDPWHQDVGRSSKSRKIRPWNRGVCLTHRFVIWGVLKAK